MQLSDGKMS